MTREQIIHALAAVTRTVDTRIEIVRTILDKDGHEVGRVHRGYFTPSPGDIPKRRQP